MHVILDTMASRENCDAMINWFKHGWSIYSGYHDTLEKPTPVYLELVDKIKEQFTTIALAPRHIIGKVHSTWTPNDIQESLESINTALQQCGGQAVLHYDEIMRFGQANKRKFQLIKPTPGEVESLLAKMKVNESLVLPVDAHKSLVALTVVALTVNKEQVIEIGWGFLVLEIK